MCIFPVIPFRIILYSITTYSCSYVVVTDEQPSGNRIVIEQANKRLGEQSKAHPFPTTQENQGGAASSHHFTKAQNSSWKALCCDCLIP
ncbi:hypothetical protein AKJ16_DCAP01241 [Drosera capensis]